jgi:HAE1 family hydrophobic/amphiphilic exporter-1
MKNLIQFSLKNKFAIWLLTIIVTAVGLYSGLTMKQEILPNINVPYLNITTVYPGAAPEGVVKDISKPLEQKLHGVEGVKTLTSTSMENVSSVLIEFEYDTNLDNATATVREVLNEFVLPDGAKKPQISRFSMNSMPVATLSLSDKDSSDLEKLTRTAENEIVPKLEDVSGVAAVQLLGNYNKEVVLSFNKEKMTQLGLDEDTVKGIVQGSVLRAPLGLFEMEDAQKAVVVDGDIITIDNLKNLEIPYMPTQNPQSAQGAQGMPNTQGSQGAQGAEGTAQGAQANQLPQGAIPTGIPTVKLSEIAKIETVKKVHSISRTNGKDAIGIQVVKSNDANTVEVVNAVKDTIDQLGKDYPSVQFNVIMDQGQPVTDSVNTMLSKALFGAIFAIFIILIFLRDIRSTIISIISIPLSLLIAVLGLKEMDISLNMMTLGAMTVAIGRVVDDSIVVIENVYRRLSLKNEKIKGGELIIDATREMLVPILSSTIVTIAVFLPLAYVSGMVGALFKPFALTMVFSLLASFVVAITLVPALAHTLFRNGVKGKQHNHEGKPRGLAKQYQKILNWSLSHKMITFGAAIILLIGSAALYPLIGVSFIPEQGDKYAIVAYSPGPGDTLEDVQEKMLKAEKYVLKQKDVEKVQYSIGGGNQLTMASANSKSALFFVGYHNDVKDFENVKKELIAGLETEVPKGTWADNSAAMFSGFTGNGLTVNVFGDNLKDIEPVSEQILTWIKEDTKTFEKAKTSLSTSYEQYTIVANQQKLSSLGLTAGQIAMKLSPERERPVLTNVEVDGKDYKVYVNADSEAYSSIKDMENATITSPLGMEVKIKDVAKIEKGTSPNSIMRIDGKMVVTVSANILTDNVQSASDSISKKIDTLKLPEGVKVTFGGVTEQIADTFGQLGIAMIAAVAIVYFILVVTFGGGLAPFAVLFSLPFIIIGAMIALLLAGETINVSALMGVLMLIGIVVTNAIVLVDRVIHKEREGLSTREALLEAGATRLRPILMTALATIGALLPLITGLERSAGIISKGLGVTVIGGLISSTLLTLVIVPIVYEFLMGFKKPKGSKQVVVNNSTK